MGGVDLFFLGFGLGVLLSVIDFRLTISKLLRDLNDE